MGVCFYLTPTICLRYGPQKVTAKGIYVGGWWGVVGLCVTRPPWWRHQMETFSALLAICAGSSPVTGEFPAQRPVTRSFGVFFDLRLNKRSSIQSWGWWFETPRRPLWRHCNGRVKMVYRSKVFVSMVVSDTLPVRESIMNAFVMEDSKFKWCFFVVEDEQVTEEADVLMWI